MLPPRLGQLIAFGTTIGTVIDTENSLIPVKWADGTLAEVPIDQLKPVAFIEIYLVGVVATEWGGQHIRCFQAPDRANNALEEDYFLLFKDFLFGTENTYYLKDGTLAPYNPIEHLPPANAL